MIQFRSTETRLTFCVAFIAAGWLWPAHAAEPLSLPGGFQNAINQTTAPNVQFQDPRGLSVSLTDWRGKVIILNLWATWCAPCVKEIPSLDRLSARLSPQHFAVVIVSQDKAGTVTTKPFLDKLGIKNLRSFVDPVGRLSRELGVRGLPTTFVVDSNGTVLGRLEGSAEWDADVFVRGFQALVK